MRNTLQVIGLALMIVGSLSGCATAPSFKNDDQEREARPYDVGHSAAPIGVNLGAKSFVNDQMSQTLSSIDHSLKTLLILDRGEEAPRKSGPIGDTVAGAAGPPRASYQPPVIPNPRSDHVLDRRVRIQWYGSPEEMLATLARSIGYQYAEVGHGYLGSVRISKQDMSIRALLGKAASQIDGHADIRVDTVAKRIDLIHR